MKITSLTKQFLLPQEHGLFNYCHASTLVRLPEGNGLLAAFSAGEREGASDTAIWSARWQCGQWQRPRRLIAEEGLAHWNPVLHLDRRRIWLFYKVGNSTHTWTTRYVFSDDSGASWSACKPLVEGDLRPRGPSKNKLVILSNRAWLAPGSVETERAWDAFADYSDDFGGTWRKCDVPFIHHQARQYSEDGLWQGLSSKAFWENNLNKVLQWDGVIQPTLWESAPGRVHMLLRSTRGWVYRSDSSDYGRSWRQAYPTKLPNNNSGIDLVHLEHLEAGRLVLAFNPVKGNWARRYPIAVICSLDNGASWINRLELETEAGEFSYPAIIADGSALHLSYTWNRKNIVHHQLSYR